MTTFATYGLMVVVFGLVALILTKRYNFPLMTDIGMGMMAFGLVGAIDAIQSDESCTVTAMVMRWGFVGGGMLLMLLSVLIKISKSKGGRSTDFVHLSEDEMAKVRGRGRG